MKKILIIDDDKEFISELSDALKDMGYHTIICDSCLKGLNIINKNKVDLILLDYKMPDINGVEFVKIVKERNIKIRIILISASTEISELIEKEKIGDNISLILNKTFEINFLFENIEFLININ